MVYSLAPGFKQFESTPCQPRSQSQLEGTASLLQKLSTAACVELINRKLPAVSSLPASEAGPQAVLRVVVPFIDEYGYET